MRPFESPSSAPVQITVSVLLGLCMAWGLGFLLFFGLVATQKPEAPDLAADAAVVLTGAQGRVEAGLDLLLQGRAKALFISGVHPDVTLKALVALWPASARDRAAILRHCCITLGHFADNTEANARETAAWIAKQKNIKSVLIVTSDYHVPRAWLLFRRAMPQIAFYVWPVSSNGPASSAFWKNILSEYTKTLLTWAA